MIVLASASAGRRELLRAAGLPFVPVASGVVEPPPSAVDAARPHAYTRMLARRKAMAVRARLADRPRADPPLVVGCDTCVHLDGAILGKPRDRRQAGAYLRRLSNRAHRVISGLCVVDGRSGEARETSVESVVQMRRLSGGALLAYLRGGEWVGAAGGYRAQGQGAQLIERIRGSRSNVVGLPLEALYGILDGTEPTKGERVPRGKAWR